MAILSELPLSDGSVSVKGKLAYAGQQAWVFSSTVKQNILFGHEMNKKRYNEVLRVTALQQVSADRSVHNHTA
jgi:ATP-binding cassette subfamily C (CFTR/MRP) protein 4